MKFPESWLREHVKVDATREELSARLTAIGLEVEALNGAPGVHSARYAGEAKDPAANMARLLQELEGRAMRSARFRTVIAFVAEGVEHTVEGEVRGDIIDAPRGTGGFGYDPVFRPEMSTLTFAEMDAKTKNAISHRGQAIWKLVSWLSEGQRALPSP